MIIHDSFQVDMPGAGVSFFQKNDTSSFPENNTRTMGGDMAGLENDGSLLSFAEAPPPFEEADQLYVEMSLALRNFAVELEKGQKTVQLL